MDEEAVFKGEKKRRRGACTLPPNLLIPMRPHTEKRHQEMTLTGGLKLARCSGVPIRGLETYHVIHSSQREEGFLKYWKQSCSALNQTH